MAMRLWLCVFSVFVLLPWTAWGQDYSFRAYGGAGIGRYYEDEGSLGTAVSYRGGVEWRPWHRIGLEAEISGIHHSRDDRFHVRGNALSASGSALLYFSSSRVQPYIFGGLGFLRSDYDYGWPDIGLGNFHRRADELAVHFGGGAQFFINRRWSLDPEVRIAVSQPSWYGFVNYFSMSASYHW